ncbi:receptor-transporting protein 3-like [Rhinatrema bivittatum]|uniref:receptor-transporting protein 3-like n=1 Tax=Rhinatrema bivittatum TaxID=194408 RepID=UPI001127ED72|nr:receptor-transporting protein 3-like [Rhinatrema bivittatum]
MDLYIWNSILEDKLKKKGLNDPWTLALDDSIQPNQGWKRYTLQIFGRFRCSGCSRTWASAKIQILFHMKLETMPERRGWVKMRVFKQECKKCSGATFEEPEFLSENIEVALEKLVSRIQEKCYRDLSGKSTTSAFNYTGKQDGPHESAHCEACRLGLCDLKPQGQEPGNYSSTGKTMPASAPKAEKHRRLDQTPIRSLYNTEGLKEHQQIESAPQYKTRVYVSQTQKPLSSIYNSWRAEDKLQPISVSLNNPSGSVNQTQKPLSSVYNSGRAEDNLQAVSASLYNPSGFVNQTQKPLSSVYNSGRAEDNLQPISASLYNPSGSVNQTQKPLSSIYNSGRAGNNLQTVPASLNKPPASANQSQKPLSSVYNSGRAGNNLQPMSASPYNPSGTVNQSQKSLSSVYNREKSNLKPPTVPFSVYNSSGSVKQVQKASTSQARMGPAVRGQLYTLWGSGSEQEKQRLLANSTRSNVWKPQAGTKTQSRKARLPERSADVESKSICPCTLV